MLKIENLKVKTKDKVIIDNFNLEIAPGEIQVLMGPNGVGKSTICKAIMHHPDYNIVDGKITFNDHNLNLLDTTSISRLGIFLLNQNPVEVEGITNAEMLRTALSERNDTKVYLKILSIAILTSI